MSDLAQSDPRLRRDATGTWFALGKVDGHTLLAAGEAYLAVDCRQQRCATNLGGTTHQANSPTVASVAGHGHPVCGCGVLGPHLDSGKLRRRWHREHKGRVLLDQPEPAGQPRPVPAAAVA